MKISFPGGGLQTTLTSLGFGQMRDSVKNPQPLKEQTDHMRTGPLKKIKKAPVQTSQQWQLHIARNPDALGELTANLSHELENIDGKAFPTTKSNVKHRLGRLLNTVLSVPDAGNAKQSRSAVLSQSAQRRLPDNKTSLARLKDGVKSAASTVRHLATPEGKMTRSGDAPLQSERWTTTAAFRAAVESEQALLKAQRVLNQAEALGNDLQQASDVVTIAHKLADDLRVAEERRAACEKRVAELEESRQQAKADWDASYACSSQDTSKSAQSLMRLAAAEADLKQASQDLAEATENLTETQTRIAATEQAYGDAQALEVIRQSGSGHILAAIANVDITIAAAREQVRIRDSERKHAITLLKHAELSEMKMLVESLPGFAAQHAVMELLRTELRKFVDRLASQDINLAKSRVPSPMVLNVMIGALDQVIASRHEGESEADAATRRCAEAVKVLREFSANLPPASSDAHLRWEAAVRSLPGGMRVMDQLGFRPYDEEATVVFARQIARDQPDMAHIANKVALRGQVEGLDAGEGESYEAALVKLLENREAEKFRQELVIKNTARRVQERAEKSLLADVPGADRNALMAARRAAQQINADGHTRSVTKDDLNHYKALCKEQESVRRTASYVGAVARNLAASNDPRVDPKLMKFAADAADSIYDKGHDFDLSESIRACFYAVRNGFLSSSDPNLIFAEERLDKLNSAWIARARRAAAQEKFDRTAKLKKTRPGESNPSVSSPALTRAGVQDVQKTRAELREEFGDQLREGLHEARLPNPMRDKSPFKPTTLKEAGKISTLGYAHPARPMDRLDKSLRKMLKDLDQCVGTIAPGSLSAHEAILLAATLAAGDKTRANASMRPGEVTLEKGEESRIQAIFDERIRPLVDPLVLKQNESVIASGIAQLLGGAVPPTMAAAHNLVELVNELSNRIPAALEDGSDNLHRSSMMKHAGIASDMIRTTVVTDIYSVVDLYNYLKPMIQQLELRGKVKSSSGGGIGVSTRLITFPIDLLLELSGLPRGAVGINAARHAVFEIGFSTTGFEIFIGSETRNGAFASAGFGVREDVAQVLGFGAAIDKTVAIDYSTIPGVWLKFPRGDGDEVVRDRALAGLQTLLGIKDESGNVSVVENMATLVSDTSPMTPGVEEFRVDSGNDRQLASASNDEINVVPQDVAPLIPGRIGKLLATNPHMSVSVVADYREINIKNEVAASINVLSTKMAPMTDMPRIALLQAGASTVRRKRKFKLSEATGWMVLNRFNLFNGGNVMAQGTIAGVSDSLDTAHPDKSSLAFGSALAKGRQIHEKGVDTKYRGISRDGEINAVDTRLDTENVNLKNHLARIEANRSAWIQCGIDELFKSPDDPTPMREKIRIAEDWLNKHIEDVKEVANGNMRHVFSLSYSLKPAAGGILDGFNADTELQQRLMAAGKGRNSQEAYAQNLGLMNEVMLDQSSWREWKITASERTSERVRKGWLLGLEYSQNNVGEGQRGFNSYPK